MKLPIDLECGDLIAFSGVGAFSEIIKWSTDFPRNLISHVGVMISPTMLVEATTLNGENGVTAINFEVKMETYPGGIYACPLKGDQSAKLDREKFIHGMMERDGMPYSKLQAFLAPFHAGKDLHNWASSWYCSKLAAEAYKEGGLLLSFMNTALTPSELTKLTIFAPLVLLKDKSGVVK